jgi:hypothetical protein
MKIDVKDRLFPRFGADDVVVPDLVEHRAGSRVVGDHGRNV